MKVGFIGLGHMGSAMATNLVKARHEVVVFNRSVENTRPLIELGARAATSIAEACRAEAVITMLADDAAVEQVSTAKDGILASLPKGAIHVSMSTISLALATELASLHGEAGQRFVSAPVFGRPTAAAAAKLFILAAGDPAAIAACQPLFEAMGQKTVPIGTDPPTANVVKLGGNLLIAVVIESLGEIMALADKAGIDRHTFLDALTSTLFTAPLYSLYGEIIADRKFVPAEFAARLGDKDLRLALAAARDLRVPLPLGSLLQDRFLRLLAQGGENLDWSAIGGLAAHDAGGPPPGR
jgi:3-hydroxyisobutyrate dehydrogenase-like beta-hydroxyacid dehydrogenase